MRYPRSPRTEQGSAFIMGVMIASVVSCVVLSYLELLNFQLQQEARAEAWHKALPLAEAAVEDALAALNVTTNLSALGFSATSGTWQKTRNLTYGSYQVTITNLVQPVIIGTGIVTNRGTPVQRLVRVIAQPKTFTYGVVARSKIQTNGNNSRMDSYDSSSSTYSTGGLWDITKATDNALVACLSPTTSCIDLGNGDIYGTVSLMSGGSVGYGSNGGVGSFSWLSSNSGVQSGHTNSQPRIQIADPQLPSLGTLWTPPSGKVNGNSYDMVLSTGSYSVDTLQGKVYVQGIANLVVTTSINLSGSDSVTLGPGAQLTIYMEGAAASIKGSGFINSGCSTNVLYYGLGGNTSIDLSGNASFNGMIYAPEASITAGGGGGANQDLSGAIVCNSISLSGNASFHYDRNSRKVFLLGFFPASWTEM